MNIFDDLIKLARERKDQPLEGSYTNKLLNDKSLSKAKVLEEINELIEAVENDTNKAFKMLSPQGVIVWHDYKPDAPDVFKYLNELSKTIELIHIKDTDLVLHRQQSA